MSNRKKRKKSKGGEPMKLISPKVDATFKKVFSNEKLPEILIGFLNAVLDYSEEEKITSVEIKNPHNDKDYESEKNSILDVKAETNHKEILNIEIQVTIDYSMIPRSEFYGSKIFSSQANPKSRDYRKLKKVICINILDFCLPELVEEDFHSVHKRCSMKTGKPISEAIVLHFVELPKLTDDQWNTSAENWFQMIKDPNKFFNSDKKNPNVESLDIALSELNRLSLSPKDVLEHEAREQFLWDQESKRESSKEEGREEGKNEYKVEVILEMFHNGVTFENIALYTKTPISDVQKIIKNE